jgi:hypothetical protein
MTGDPIPAILDQLARHAERMDCLNARQHADHGDLSARIQALAGLVARMDVHVADQPGSREQGEHDRGTGSGQHAPAPVRRWWTLDGTERAAAIGVLRAWTGQVYQPGYGSLAAGLGPCWEQHPLCLYALDILAELWSVLYLSAERTPGVLSAQAEYQARILPALASQMAAETTRCRHHAARTRAAGHPGSPP